jgi:hypothetical protein
VTVASSQSHEAPWCRAAGARRAEEHGMGTPEVTPPGRTVIGGRHGSPSVTIALPFSHITNTDTELRDTVADLASLVAQLARAARSGDREQLRLVRTAAEAIAERLSTQS